MTISDQEMTISARRRDPGCGLSSGTATTNYGYDGAGNRTQAGALRLQASTAARGSRASTYDALGRDGQLTALGGTMTVTARLT